MLARGRRAHRGTEGVNERSSLRAFGICQTSLSPPVMREQEAEEAGMGMLETGVRVKTGNRKVRRRRVEGMRERHGDVDWL